MRKTSETNEKLGVGGLVWRLVCAAVAVVGVGGVIAAGIQGLTATNSEGGPVIMKASYHVENIAIIEGLPSNPTGSDLFNNSVDSVNHSSIGTLGFIRVRTNAGSWDVTMKTDWGGKLVKNGGIIPNGRDICTPQDFPLPCKPGKADSIVPGYALVYSIPMSSKNPSTKDSLNIKFGASGAKDTVLLAVSIGFANGTNAEDTSKGSSFGATFAKGAKAAGDKFEATVIPKDSLIVSNVENSEISFAKTFYNHYFNSDGGAKHVNDSLGTTKWKTWHATNGGKDSATRMDLSDSLNIINGFGITAGFGPTYKKQWEYFYINVGIKPEYEQYVIGQKTGDYEETFTFDLVTNFE